MSKLSTKRDINSLALLCAMVYFISYISRINLSAVMVEVVSSGHLAGAAVDVYEQEPLPMDASILHTPGILCTPHTGAETLETYQNISIMAAQAVIDSLSGKEPRNWINR